MKKGRFPPSPLFLLIRAFLGTAHQRGLNFFVVPNLRTRGENLGISAFAGMFEAVSRTPSARLQRAGLSSVVGAGVQEQLSKYFALYMCIQRNKWCIYSKHLS